MKQVLDKQDTLRLLRLSALPGSSFRITSVRTEEIDRQRKGLFHFGEYVGIDKGHLAFIDQAAACRL